MVNLSVVVVACARPRQHAFASALSAGGRLTLARLQKALGMPRKEWSWQVL